MKKITIILLIILSTSGCLNKGDIINNYKTNNNDGVISEKQYDRFKIDNISIIYKDNLSTLTFDLINTSNDKLAISEVEAILKVNNGGILTTLSEKVNTTINVGESMNVVLISDIDLTDAARFDCNIR